MDAIPRRRLLTLSAATAAGGAMLLRARPAHAGPPYAEPPQRPPRLPELPEPTSGEVSVHDPSVAVPRGVTYRLGPRLAAAKSDDLLARVQVADLVTPEHPPTADVTTRLAESL